MGYVWLSGSCGFCPHSSKETPIDPTPIQSTERSRELETVCFLGRVIGGLVPRHVHILEPIRMSQKWTTVIREMDYNIREFIWIMMG